MSSTLKSKLALIVLMGAYCISAMAADKGSSRTNIRIVISPANGLPAILKPARGEIGFALSIRNTGCNAEVVPNPSLYLSALHKTAFSETWNNYYGFDSASNVKETRIQLPGDSVPPETIVLEPGAEFSQVLRSRHASGQFEVKCTLPEFVTNGNKFGPLIESNILLLTVEKTGKGNFAR